jgi:putative membrane protein
MKTTIKHRTELFHINLIIIAALLTGACNNGKQSDAAIGADSKPDTIASSRDAKFLAKVALINMEEIRLGELAQQNSSTQDVKELGQMMVDDHKNSQEELVQLAAKKSITLPTSMDSLAMADYNKLVSKSGTEFDKGYTDMMVNGHKGAIALFESESKDASDADVRQWAGSVLPTLQKHLDHSLACQAKCNNM